MNDELTEISSRYQRRRSISPDRYCPLNPVMNLIVQERERALVDLFKYLKISSLSTLRILEIGCGSGANLVELIKLGATPGNLVGNDLIEERLSTARARLPDSVKLIGGDASQLQLERNSFDIVYQSTVLSSVLDAGLQSSLTHTMWSLVKPGGGILWYDFTVDNPLNPDVRGIPVARVKQLFPTKKIWVRKVTLAPPIARQVVGISPILYHILNCLPFLRTHVLCYVAKS